MFIITLVIVGVLYWAIDAHHDKKNKAEEDKDYYFPYQQNNTYRQLPPVRTEDAKITKRK